MCLRRGGKDETPLPFAAFVERALSCVAPPSGGSLELGRAQFAPTLSEATVVFVQNVLKRRVPGHG